MTKELPDTLETALVYNSVAQELARTYASFPRPIDSYKTVRELLAAQKQMQLVFLALGEWYRSCKPGEHYVASDSVEVDAAIAGIATAMDDAAREAEELYGTLLSAHRATNTVRWLS